MAQLPPEYIMPQSLPASRPSHPSSPAPITILTLPHPRSGKFISTYACRCLSLSSQFISSLRHSAAFPGFLLMRGWTYDTVPNKSSLAMPAQSPLLDERSQRGYHQQQTTQYFLPQPQTSSSIAAMSAGSGHAPYVPHLLWHSATQSINTDFSDSPLGTPYSETGSTDSAYYMADASSHTVAYPESSQRTHLSDGVAFAAMYHNDFNHELAAMAGQLSSSSTPSATSNRVNQLPSNASSYRQLSSSQARERAPRTNMTTSSPYSLETPPSNGRLSPQRLMGYPSLASTRSSTNSQANVQSVQSNTLSHSTPASPRSHTDFHSSAPMPMHTSPTLQAYEYHRSAAAMHRLGEPGSPSVVPPLVFDGEAGEEYEDESEYGSLGSDLSRHQSLRQGNHQYSGAQGHGGDDWASNGFDHHRSFDDNGSPSSQHSQFESQSPMHGADLELSPQLGSEDGGKATKKSKMHQCTVCAKWFPRPSGLATHMNSHSGARRKFSKVLLSQLKRSDDDSCHSVQMPHSDLHEKLRGPFKCQAPPAHAWYLPNDRTLHCAGAVYSRVRCAHRL